MEEANNIKAMREALEDSQWLLEHFSRGDYSAQVREQMIDNRAALAAPPRNCDVGTAEEQEDRFSAFCKAHECTMNCPIKKKWSFKRGHQPSCGVLFAQMPYEEEEEEGESIK